MKSLFIVFSTLLTVLYVVLLIDKINQPKIKNGDWSVFLIGGLILLTLQIINGLFIRKWAKLIKEVNK